MRAITRGVVIGLSLLAGGPTSQAHDLEKGVAITDPAVVRALDAGGFGLGSMLVSGWSAGDPMSNRVWHATPAVAPIYVAIKEETANYLSKNQETYVENGKTKLRLGVGMGFDRRLFDVSFLSSPNARFVLVGVVNRMDRAFKYPATCGEVRLIYRLNYTSPAGLDGTRVSSRLPMTINLVLRAKDAADTGIDCKTIAERWIKAGDATETGAALVAKLAGAGGPLSQVRRSLIDRIEINMQLARWPATQKPEFGGLGVYLLRVFAYDPASNAFRKDSLLENQIDREKLLGNPALRREFRDWVLKPDTIKALDDGTLIIPDKYLARRAISVNPGGSARSENRPFSRPKDDLVSDGDITAALRRLKALSTTPTYIPTAYGFQHRLNDMTCTGCHQTRSVAGFHFMGHEWKITLPANSVFTATSPHFLGDAPRRRDITEAFAAGREPDFSKGFASRPQRYRSKDVVAADGRVTRRGIVGTGLFDGWAAHCNKGSDPSFQSWDCARGHTCKVAFQNEREPDMGICVTAGKHKIGDAFEFGTVRNAAFGDDRFTPTSTELKPPANFRRGQPWILWPTGRSGGFSGGMVRATSCPDKARGDKPLPPEAVCAILPSSKPTRPGEEGFNTCLVRTTFPACLKKYSEYVGLRACDALNPCRDDYICTATDDPKRGACLPPYFLFQFRIDGHIGGAAR